MSQPRGRFARSNARQGDSLRHQIPAPCPHSPATGFTLIGALFTKSYCQYIRLSMDSQSYISSLPSFCGSSYSLRSYSNKLLQVPRSKLKSYGDRRFSIAGPKLWNSIPASLRNTDSLNSFKKHLKTFISPSFFLIYKQIFIHFSYLYMQLLDFQSFNTFFVKHLEQLMIQTLYK